MNLACPQCGNELEPVWVCSNTNGNDNAEWCVTCEMSVCWHHAWYDGDADLEALSPPQPVSPDPEAQANAPRSRPYPQP